jgi:hypothetical protein
MECGKPVASPGTQLEDETQVAKKMSPLEQLDQALDNIIRELTLRILVPRLGEFDRVWEIANQVCDRYHFEHKL